MIMVHSRSIFLTVSLHTISLDKVSQYCVISWQKKRHWHRACVQAKTVRLIACKVKRKKGGAANNIRDDFWEPLYDFRFSDNQDSQRQHTEEITVVQFTHTNSKAESCWWLDIGVRGRIKTGQRFGIATYVLSFHSIIRRKSHILHEVDGAWANKEGANQLSESNMYLAISAGSSDYVSFGLWSVKLCLTNPIRNLCEFVRNGVEKSEYWYYDGD